MKNTTLKTRLWALAATLLLLISLLAMPVSAANAPVAGGTFDFNKYLVMNANANVPNVEFTFTIDAGEPVNAGNGQQKIYAGIVQNTGETVTAPTVTEANFSYNTDNDNTANGLPSDTTTTTQNKKYATKEVTVDFSGISFTAPGIYRYIITETASTASYIQNDTATDRTLDVYVQYKNNGSEDEPNYSDTELVVSNYVLHEGLEDPAAQGEEKSDGFTNTYTTYDLTLTKSVTGNQGDRDKYFAFTVEITGAVEGTVYTVDLSDAESTPNVDGTPHTNDATLIATSGSVNATYYLKHGQSIVIQGLTADTYYNIEESNYSTDGYSTAYSVEVGGDKVVQSTTSNSTGDRKMSIDATESEGTATTGDNTVTFTNSKSGTVPTGILLETAPYLILGAVVVVGLVVLFATHRRRTRE